MPQWAGPLGTGWYLALACVTTPALAAVGATRGRAATAAAPITIERRDAGFT